MKYNAFISYRHSELDMMVAKTIHKGLETFKVPKSIQKKTGRKNIQRVFRDQEELPIGSDLGDNIRQALENSEFLIVICSPRSKESYWVQKEIETFIELHGREHILAVLIEGEPDEAFPELILTDEEGNPVEPLAADLREASSKKVQKKLKTELMRLAAPLLGCSYDDLRQRHRERRMRRMIAGISFLAVAGILFGIYSSYNAYMIRKNFQEKQINESKFMAEKSAELLEYGDRRAAALLAMEAMPGEEGDRPYVASAELALSRALRCYDTGTKIAMDRILRHNLPVKEFDYNMDGTMIVSVDLGDGVYVWDISTGERLNYSFPDVEDHGGINRVKRAAITKDGKLFIARELDICLQELDGTVLWKQQLPEFDGEKNRCIYAYVNEESNVAICGNGTNLYFVDLSSGAYLNHIHNPLEYSFSSDIIFSKDGKSVAIPHYVKDGTLGKGFLSVYDIENNSLKSLDVQKNYIEEIDITDDGKIVVLSIDGEIFNPSVEPKEDYYRIVECIDPDIEKLLWSQKINASPSALYGSSSILKSRSYQDDFLGKEVSYVHVATDGEVSTIDGKTGEIVSRLHIGTNISSLKLAAKGPLGFVAGADGVIRICDLAKTVIYTEANVNTGKNIGEMGLYKGVAVLREPLSPDLSLMTYYETEGMEQVDSFDSYVATMMFSKNDSFYAVEASETEGNIIYFYKTNEDERLAEWIPEMDEYYKIGTFLDDDSYFIKGSNGTLAFYDVKKEKAEYLKVAEGIIPEYYITSNKEYLLVISSKKYFVVDLSKRKVIYDGEMEKSIRGYSLSEDGRKASFHFGSEGIVELDLETKNNTEIDINGAKVFTSFLGGHNMVYSQDGKYLACSCIDHVLRIIDLETNTVCREIPFVGGQHSFISFVEGTTEILMQGDDYYLRVYDIAEDELVYASIDQYPIITELDKKDMQLGLRTSLGVIVLNSADYQLILDNADVRLFSTDKKVVYCEHNNKIYRFPYMNEQKLYEEVKRQFPNAVLTEEERIRFNLQ